MDFSTGLGLAAAAMTIYGIGYLVGRALHRRPGGVLCDDFEVIIRPGRGGRYRWTIRRDDAHWATGWNIRGYESAADARADIQDVADAIGAPITVRDD